MASIINLKHPVNGVNSVQTAHESALGCPESSDLMCSVIFVATQCTVHAPEPWEIHAVRTKAVNMDCQNFSMTLGAPISRASFLSPSVSEYDGAHVRDFQGTTLPGQQH